MPDRVALRANAGLIALDAEAEAVPIWLVTYREAKQVAAVELSPQRAIAIAAQLIAAASRRWPA